MKNENNARWLDITDELWSRLGYKHYKCSACGYNTGIRTDKCFNCCAEMDVEELKCQKDIN